jgi:hypothetical protein
MDCLMAYNQFSHRELQDINRCRIYMRAFFISDIMNIQGTLVEPCVLSSKRPTTRTSAWAWPVQQRPTNWKTWKDALEFIAPERTVTPAIGTWIKEHHQTQEWHYDPEDKTIYHHVNGLWEIGQAQKIGRIRFCTVGTPCSIPLGTTHTIDIKHRARYMEIFHEDEVKHYVKEQPTPLNTYTFGIGNCIQALPKHTQRLVGNIPTIATPTGWDTTETKYLIVTTDGSVLFGVGYHRWVIVTADEEILLTGGGPDDGDPLIMKSFRS